MYRKTRRLLCAAITVLALAASGLAGLTGTGHAASGGTASHAAANTTIVVDDAQQGSGQDQFNYQGAGWGHASGEGAPANPYQGTNSWTDHAGDSVTFAFVGTQLTFYGITAPQHGIGAVSIDGGAPATVDFYSANRTGDVPLWTSPVLPDGPHTFTLAWTGQKNPASTGTPITVDRVSFNGQPPPPPHTNITVNPAGTGRTFDGVGAISGGGGNSRLLIDYPPKQRNQILDYLFKPGYGASLQILKLEIGGDANSTDGSEPSIEHTKGVVNCNAGYEFWLAEQAKARNPNIKLYGLAWAAPGWIGNGNFWSQDMIDYLRTWLGCAKTHGLTIDYLGGWNERGYNKAWYENLHATLAAGHYPTKVVGDDSGWDEADAMATDPAFAKSIDILGAHYSCQGGDGGNADSCSSTQNAIGTGKPLWDSEQGSQDDNSGAGPLIRAITRGYIDAKMTALLNWPLIAAITPNLPYPTDGMMVANQPWSGNYSVGDNTWVTAQVTQFAQPGWQFLDSASGYLGGDRANGSYVSLRSPDGSDFSTIAETTTATAASTASFTISGGLSAKPVQVWATNVNSTSDSAHFVHLADVTPDSSGSFTYTLQPGYVYTFSTVTTAGKGAAAAPAPHALTLPYSDTFNEYPAGQEARYVSDMQGAFEVQPCAAGRRGMCLQQMAPVKPIEWQQDSDAFTLVGDPSWTNYTVRTDAELTKPGTVEVIGRAGTQNRPQSDQQGYYFQISSTGAWTIFKSDAGGNRTVLAAASVAPLGISKWHRLALSFAGPAITASVDGQAVGTVEDASYTAGQAGLGITSYDTDQFDNLSITPSRVQTPPATVTVAPSAPTVQGGKDVTVTATVSVPRGAREAEGVNVSLDVPAGFTYDSQAQVFGAIKPGSSAVATWDLTAPADAASTASIGATVTLAQRDVATWVRGSTQVQVTNPPAPAGATVGARPSPSPASRAQKPPVTVTVAPSAPTVQRGKDVTVTATVSVPRGARKAEGVNVSLDVPAGFTYDSQAQVFGAIKPGSSAVATWDLTAPADAASTASIGATVTLAQRDVATWVRGSTQVQVTNPPAPTGVNDVSALPFLSATNGWGPVERNQSVGGSNANDGNPLTIHGTVYPKGLGTNSVSDVQIYLGGNCSSFTSVVGIDDEVGGNGSATFSVVGDGKTLASTATIRGGDPAQQITANVSGVQTLDLVVGDAGDGNAYDHGDWAMPVLTCAG